MVRLKTIQKNGTVAWSPLAEAAGMLAVGSAAGALDDSFEMTSQLELYSLDLGRKGSDMSLLGRIEAPDRFNRLTWGGLNTMEQGLLAGGLVDGTICLWDPAKLHTNDAEQSLVFKVERHEGPVRGLEFNPFQPNLLASGDSEILIWNVQQPSSASPYSPSASGSKSNQTEISALAWNRKVQHILASTSYGGVSVVWDLKQKKPVLTFQNPSQKLRCSSLAWNPEAATQIAVASDDDRSPSIQIWDLRNAYAPVKELTGHSKGILSLSWCPNDSNLLVSCGKDNRAICWNPNSGEILCELPAANNWLFDVQWSPRIPALLTTSSFEGKITVHSLQDSSSVDDDHSLEEDVPMQSSGEFSFGRQAPASRPSKSSAASASNFKTAPKWLQRTTGATFGFGGKLISFANPSLATPAPTGTGRAKVSISHVQTDTSLPQAADQLEKALASGDLKSFCEERAAAATSETDRTEWQAMRTVLEYDFRGTLLRGLGYDSSSLAQEVQKACAAAGLPSQQQQQEQEQEQQQAASSASAIDEAFSASIDGDDDLAASLADMSIPNNVSPSPSASSPTPAAAAAAVSAPQTVTITVPAPNPDLDRLLLKVLTVGDYESAVNCCLAAGRMDAALVFAARVGGDLWERTQSEFYRRQAGHPVMQAALDLCSGRVREVVLTSPLSQWRDTLAMLSTYTDTAGFQPLVTLLADRLTESGDKAAAALCYMYAGDMNQVIAHWLDDLSRQTNGTYARALQSFVEKVCIYQHATSQSELTIDISDVIAQYADLLAIQGCFGLAYRYLSAFAPPAGAQESVRRAILRDRLRAASAPAGQAIVPELPATFERVNVTAQRPVSAPVQPVPVVPVPAPAPAPVQQHYSSQQQQQQQQQHYHGGQQGGQAYGAAAAAASAYAGGQSAQAMPSYSAAPAAPAAYQHPARQPSPVYAAPTPVAAPAPAFNTPVMPVSRPAPLPVSSSSSAAAPSMPSYNPPVASATPSSSSSAAAGSAAVASPPSAQAASAVLTQALSSLSAVDTSAMQHEVKSIVSTLTSLFDRAYRGPLSASDSKKVEAISSALADIFRKLNAQAFAQDAVQKLIELSQAVERGDHKATEAAYLHLTQKYYESFGAGLGRVKMLLADAQKKQLLH